MTKYPQVNSHKGESKFKRSSSWKKYGSSQKWRSYIGIFIVIILVFAIFNGLLKTISIKKFIDDFRWDGSASFAVVLGSSPPSLFVYQPDPKRMVIMTIPEDFYFATGRFLEPLAKISDVLGNKNGDELARMTTVNFGTKFEKYAMFDGLSIQSRENAEELFKRFASISTPIEILRGFGDVQTNITRGEMFGLWWQIKGLSIDQLELVDLSGFSEQIVLGSDQKVLGADEQALNREIKPYLESHRIIEKGVGVEIQNASGSNSSAGLAVDLASSVGFDVADISVSEAKNAKTVVFSADRNSYEAKLLAMMFDCDILGIEKERILVVLGQDFAAKYFE